MEKKRRPIRQRVQHIVMLLCVAALLLTGAVGLGGLLTIRRNVRRDNQDLGTSAAGLSRDALLGQAADDLMNLALSTTDYADAQMSRYKGYIENFAFYIHQLYQEPEAYRPRPVSPPRANSENEYTMQRYLADETVDMGDVAGEMELLGNLEQTWLPVIENNSDMIGTIYVGTESGFMLSCDDQADLAAGEGEAYYDYFASKWYAAARDAEGPVFTDAYADSYGRGLAVTCAAPFYDEQDRFAGVVGMDILLEDMNRSVIGVSFKDGTYAFLVDRSGTVLAAPYSEEGGGPFSNIRTDPGPVSEAAESILSGETGITEVSGGVMYVYAPIATADWVLVFHVPASEVTAPAEDIRVGIESRTGQTGAAIDRNIIRVLVTLLGVFALIAAAVAVLTGRFARHITEPLLALGRDVEKISGGDLDHRAQVQDNDEVGDLAASFNAMAGSLDKYIHDLTAVTAEKERIGAELDIARHIQSSMLPCIFPAFPDRPEIDIFASMDPAKEVGGDFYDFFMVDRTHLAVVVADVSGKGVSAALFMVVGKTLIKDHTTPGRDLGEVFMEVNRLLCEGNSQEMFITAFEGVLDLVTGQFNFVNAGHELPFISRKGGDYEAYKTRPGFVLAGLEGTRYRMGSMKLEPGDKLFQYTDGVTEATDANGRLYGMERLEAVLNANREAKPRTLLTAVKKDIDGFVGAAPQFDDITMLCLEFKQWVNETPDVLTVEARTENIDVVTDFIAKKLAAYDCPPKAVAEMQIIADEIVANVSMYAYPAGETGSVTVTTAVEEDTLTACLTFADRGVPYDPLAKPDPDVTLPAEKRRIGGLGVYMVKQMADDVRYEYHDGQNILTVRKRLQ